MTSADFAAVQDLERAAGEQFRQVDMAAIAEDEPLSDEELQGFVDSGWAWVLVPDEGAAHDDGVVAYAVGELLDEAAHLEQLSVDPGHARQGLGARLVQHLRDTARQRGFTRVSLTTFADVPWNASYYARLGFRILPEEDWGPEVRARVAEEATHGLDRWPRVVMVAEV
ncbi:GNAT family N-acetyltransferase [Arthrobacter sp. NPDC090010]|uniref:GNAT family N-acetyltransferase n=1 Tax=Arthrobacter sp. NPDC090010 TaxID=3363942 RepID=UPI003813D717